MACAVSDGVPSGFLLPLVFVAALLPPAGQTRARPKSHQPVRMTATAYCDKGITDGGVRTRPGIVAADPRLLPIGTVLRIDGLGPRTQTYVVKDTGSAVKGRHVDIFMPNCRAAKRFGRRPIIVRAVGAEGPSEKRVHTSGR